MANELSFLEWEILYRKALRKVRRRLDELDEAVRRRDMNDLDDPACWLAAERYIKAVQEKNRLQARGERSGYNMAE